MPQPDLPLLTLAAAALALPALAGSAPAAAAPARAAAAGLCQPGETVAFACSTAKGLAYVCAAKGSLQYRFGRPGALALSVPASGPGAGFHLSRTGYAGGGESRLRFTNGGYDYVLYDRLIAGDWDKAGHRAHSETQGVLVVKDGRKVSNLMCRGAQDGLKPGADVAPEEPFDDDLTDLLVP